MPHVIIIFALIMSSIISLAQENKAEWELIYSDGSDKVSIDLSEVESISVEDIGAWISTEHSEPIKIESVKGKIYKTNTYYLFNTRLNKYSLLYIIYYGKNKNVIASFDYQRNTNIEAYQYNYPVWEGTLEENILKKCVEVINNKKDK